MPSSRSPTEIEYELAHIHDDRAPNIVISTVACILLAIFAVVLRLLARRLSKVRILADDYMIIFAVVICMGQVAACLYSVHLGAGKHVILLRDPAAYAQTIISMEVLYCTGTAAFKYSALLLFHRIFGSIPRFTAFLCFFAFVILANNIAEIFLSIFQCTPVPRAWDVNAEGSCVNILLAACIPGSVNVISDVVTFLLPVPLIWNLQMERNRKIQLVGIFLLSGFVCIASTYRTIIVKRLSHQDASWADVEPIIWAIVENSIGIVTASLPTMRPIYSLIVRRHHCSSVERSCERCSKSRGSRSGGSSSEKRAQKRASATSHWFDYQRSGDRNWNYRSDFGEGRSGGYGVVEMD